MQENFKKLSTQLFENLNNEETLMLSLSAENSHFCRLNQSKVRQIGNVVDTRLSLSIIYDNRICHGGITLTNDFDADLKDPFSGALTIPNSTPLKSYLDEVITG